MPKSFYNTNKFFNTVGLGLSIDSQNGLGMNVDLSVNGSVKKIINFSLGLGGAINSRQGIQSFGLSSNISTGAFKIPFLKGYSKARPSNKIAPSMGSAISYSLEQGVPNVSMPMLNTTMPVEVKIGTVMLPGQFTTYFWGSWSGNYFESEVASGKGNQYIPSYGYLNTHKRPYDALSDYNQSPIDYNNSLPFLPTSTVTNDLYLLTGQGTGGMFRPYRSEIGRYENREVISESVSKRTNLEFGATGTEYHVGFGGFPWGRVVGQKISGPWRTGNNLALSFAPFASKDYEPAYFKVFGERTVSFDNSLLDKWGGLTPVRVGIKKDGDNGGINESGNIEFAKDYVTDGYELKNEQELPSSFVSVKNKTERTPRATTIQTLTNAQAKKYGMSKNEEFYDINGGTVSKYDVDRVGEEHHITEISTLQPDGMRYIYGLGAYNYYKEDATFSVSKIKHSGDEGTLRVKVPDNSEGYAKAEDYSTGNTAFSRAPEYLDKTKTPPYVHSWLLTNVVAPDYVDLTGDGVSDDDYGYWAKFEYVRTTNDDTDGGYHWRVPFKDANYMPGTTNEFDDMGSYSKGMKELFYLKTIKTKTHVAVFEISERIDGYGASTDINGGKSNLANDKMFRLDKIKLFTRAEYDNYLNNSTDAVPIKTVVMNYNYSLCDSIENGISSSTGKLTLDKLYFTYGKSTKGERSVYKFDYNTSESYNLKNYDRWGNFKDNNKYGDLYPHMEFPYTEQGEDASTVPGLWHLNKIDLPTGGTINIEYEFDDYAYVEDKKAMQMYDIADVGAVNDPEKKEEAKYWK